MSYPAVFFDRDNTLNYDPGYLSDSSKVKLFDGVGEGLALLKNKYNFKLVVISNQSGVARGLMTETHVVEINERINEILKSNFQTSIDKFYFCPHHPEFSSIDDSSCRKPSPEMVFLAQKELNIDMEHSYFVGDKASDVECGINAGIKTVLLNYENSDGEIISLKIRNKRPNFIVQNFLNACNFIIDDFTGGNTFAK